MTWACCNSRSSIAGSECRVVGERLVPLPERKVARYDQAASLISFRDHLEEEIGLLTAHRQVSNLVDDQ